MSKRVVRVIIGLLFLVGFAFMIPASPLYLPKLLEPKAVYEGQPTSFWVKELGTNDNDKREKALFAIGAIGKDAADAVPLVAQILKEDPNPGIRQAAALTLSKMDPASKSAVDVMANALKDRNPWVRMNCCIALFRLRGEARSALPALTETLQDQDNHQYIGSFSITIQGMAALAIGRATSGTEDGLPVLKEALAKASESNVRVTFTRALGEIGPKARSMLPILKSMLKEEDEYIREAAQEAIQLIGDDGTVAEAETKKEEDLFLPEEERKYVWELEHCGNVLGKYGFGVLAQAIKQGDTTQLTQWLAPDFLGKDLQEYTSVRLQTEAVDVERRENANKPAVALNREAFIQRLMQWRQQFGPAAPQVKFSLMTIHPKVRGQMDGTWEGLAQLRFHGEHTPKAPAEIVAVLRYEITEPTEENLSKPGWLRSVSIQQVLMGKSPKYLFEDVAQQRGLDVSVLHDNWKSAPDRSSTGGAYVCDWNRDGILDLLITDVDGGFLLYQGKLEGRFENVTKQVGLPERDANNILAAWIDIDNDGWEDLILAGRIYRNDQGKRFEDYTHKSNLRLPSDASNLVVADYDRDGKLDFYVARVAAQRGSSWLSGKSGDPKGNFLFRNQGNWQFEDVTPKSGTSGGQRSTFTAAWLDVNNDQWPDLHVINEFGDGVLFINKQDGTFREQLLADRPADFGSMGMTVGDVNNDGNIDIYCANMYSKAGTRVIGNLKPNAFPEPVLEKMKRFVAGSQLHLNRGNNQFEQVGKSMQVAAVGWAYGACLADLDNDGWLDLYGTAGFISKDRDKPDG